MAKIIVDGIEVDVPPETTLLQAAEVAGAEIPRFCFHERLSVAGNCRMCLVEVKGGPPKPVASCAMAVKDMRPGPNGEPPEMFTRTPMVKKAREGTMEFLLINHPLDCPICDQGGECDLQDQSMAYGVSGSRFHENKRAVEDKYIGPLVKTVMTRCIHCTRCVRFTTEVAGVSDLGATGRGEDMEITTYLEHAMSSELQGNVVDLCPVGALTSKPYAFKARPWELAKTESVDVMDAVGSNIRVDTRGREVMRVLPRLNEAVNEEWISDKTRYIWDGLKTQRLDRPYVRRDGRLVPASWPEAFALIAEKVKAAPKDRIGIVAGDLASTEELFALKDLAGRLGVANIDARQDGTKLDPAFGRASYLFNATIAGIEKADAVLLIGANPRKEAPVLNARIRKRWRQGPLPVGVIGDATDLTYHATTLGAGAETLADLVAGQHSFAEVLGKAQRPLIVVGQGALARPDGLAILSLAAQLAVKVGAVGADWNGFSVLHTAASRVGALDVGFVPGRAAAISKACSRAASTWRFCSARTSSRSTASAAPSSSISAPTAMPAPTAPTSSCRAPPTPRSRAPGSTPRVASSAATGRPSRRATPARIGPSCVRSPRSSVPSSPTTRSRNCGRRWSWRTPISAAPTASSPPTAAPSRSSPRSAGRRARAPSCPRWRTSI